MSASDSPEPVTSEAEIDALEYVVHQGIIGAYDRPILLAWLARLQAERTPQPNATQGDGTSHLRCTLTADEREAVSLAGSRLSADPMYASVVSVLFRLLKRTS